MPHVCLSVCVSMSPPLLNGPALVLTAGDVTTHGQQQQQQGGGQAGRPDEAPHSAAFQEVGSFWAAPLLQWQWHWDGAAATLWSSQQQMVAAEAC